MSLHPARAEPEIDATQAAERARQAWRHGEALAQNGEINAALPWMERAHRLAPADQNLAFSLAMLLLRGARPLESAQLFAPIAHAHGVREAWTGLAAARLAAGQAAQAAQALANALSGNAADAGLLALAPKVAAAAGLAGWCAITGEGVLHLHAAEKVLAVSLDSRDLPVPGATTRYSLPEHWRKAATLRVTVSGEDLLGSPIALQAITRTEGYAARTGRRISGWAWHPGAPEQDPALSVVDEAGTVLASLSATAISGSVEGDAPLARPRGFSFETGHEGIVRVVAPDGRDLLGSPLPPHPKRRLPIPGNGALAPLACPARAPIAVIIPVYRGLQTTLACVRSVLATVPASTRIVLVNDASPEAELVEQLRRLASDISNLSIIVSDPADPGRNRGFPAAVNAGLRDVSGCDAILLNSDTLAGPAWLELLADAAYSSADIGTATPLSNDATILSYPVANRPNPPPDAPGTARLAMQAVEANAGIIVEIPTAHGFCTFVRHDCLAACGGFEQALFAQGYGEENDFSERARALGWRHVGVPSAYVAHVGGASFGPARTHLLRRNLDVLARLHPGYHARVAVWMAQDTLAPARRRIDALRWQEGQRQAGAVLLVNHGGGGGTARVVDERVAEIAATGARPIVLTASSGLCCVGDGAGDYPNLRFRLPGELPALLGLLQGDRPLAAELHHLLGHDHSVLALFSALAIPYSVWVHDYAWLCPRISLVQGEGRYCGEPAAQMCESCVRRWGRAIEDPVSPTVLRARSARDLAGASEVIVPSLDVAQRLRRHFPAIRPRIAPWEQAQPFSPAAMPPEAGRLRVAVVGGIGVEKGFDVLLACAQDAASRDLRLEFALVGYSIDDDRLEETGRVFVTGPFARDDAARLITAQQAHLAFLPSIWPETWCFALSDVWAAGLRAAVFDIGTPAERVRARRLGWVLPLGMPAAAVNEFLLRFANA